MKEYEIFKIQTLNNLKQNTIYFYLKSQNFSENYIKNLRKNSTSIRLNGDFCSINTKIKLEDILEIDKNPSKRSEIEFCDGDLQIIYEDNDFLIVNKPHNLACMPSRSHFYNNLGGQIIKYLHQNQPNPVLRIINRLDKETAGLVVIAKNLIATQNLKLDKTYHALCNHTFSSKRFTISKPIETIKTQGINQMERIISPNGKPAITHATVLQNFNNYSLIELKLETGRTHQIRVHLSSIGHSLIGDTIYNTSSTNTNNHAFLILKKISFIHFRTNKKIELEIDYPEDWTKYLTSFS